MIPRDSFFSDIKRILASDALYFTGTSAFRDPADLLPVEAECVAKANPVRQREFATGRWCARRLFNEMGLASAPVACGKTGEPLWPDGVCGGISHTHDACCVLTGFTNSYRSLGIDVECAERRISDPAQRLIINEDEAKWIASQQDPSGNPCMTVFSIKECLCKLLFPLVRRTVPFSAISVLPLMPDDIFACRLNEDLGEGFMPRSTFCGRLFRNDSWIVSMAVLGRISYTPTL
jgi:4'-phosphopantetheinyl transferase EntD